MRPIYVQIGFDSINSNTLVVGEISPLLVESHPFVYTRSLLLRVSLPPSLLLKNPCLPISLLGISWIFLAWLQEPPASTARSEEGPRSATLADDFFGRWKMAVFNTCSWGLHLSVFGISRIYLYRTYIYIYTYTQWCVYIYIYTYDLSRNIDFLSLMGFNQTNLECNH